MKRYINCNLPFTVQTAIPRKVIKKKLTPMAHTYTHMCCIRAVSLVPSIYGPVVPTQAGQCDFA